MISDNRLIKLTLPSDFVLARVVPTAEELAYGYSHGWLTRTDVVAIATAKLAAGDWLTIGEEALALLLSDQLDQVDELASSLTTSGVPAEAREQVWLFLALAWIAEHRDDFDDLLVTIECLYADFDYPPYISDLVGFMPANGRPSGRKAIEERLKEYLERAADEYRSRI